MKLILALCFQLMVSAGIQVPDSLLFDRLDAMLERYTAAIERESLDVKKAECDFLVSTGSDSLVTQHVALWLYDHYKESQVMGEEAIAIHLWDNWFQPGIIKMRSDFDRFDAEMFVTFNRSTLLGMTAPRVTMKNPCGRDITIPRDGTYSILFFFDTSCAKCRLEAQLMPQVLQKITFPTKFYAVYCGQDKKEWRKFRCSFRARNRNVKVVHCWDPEIESDYLRLYGVMSTPRLYFTDTDGEILGRRLEIESLDEIIHYICEYYGQAQE